MEENEFERLKVSGANVQRGTQYKDIKVAGASKFVNDIECNIFKTSGVVKSEGSIKAKVFKVAGAVKIVGSLDAPEISASGGVKVGKDITTETAAFGGSIYVGGKLSAKELHVDGTICIKGELLVDRFELHMGGKSELTEVYGDQVTIRKNWSFGITAPRHANIGLIEATTIDISHTTCKRVSGDTVVIGDGCVIDLVEYSTSITVNKKAKVKEQVKID